MIWFNSYSGNIVINDGKITAHGGMGAAGIGSGYGAKCGYITIADTVTKVSATATGMQASMRGNSIGKGKNGRCGNITIGDEAMGDGIPGNEVMSNGGYVSTYTYQPQS